MVGVSIAPLVALALAFVRMPDFELYISDLAGGGQAHSVADSVLLPSRSSPRRGLQS